MSTTSESVAPGSGARVLVLGAGGQLGQAVVARLAQDGYRVRAFQRRAAADRDPAVEVVLGTALDREAVARAAADQDAVVNVIGSGTLRRNTVESDTTAAVRRANSAQETLRQPPPCQKRSIGRRSAPGLPARKAAAWSPFR